ncbi:MAG: TonB-dependent receptor [Longimicrobiales bacterium]
MSLLRHTLTAVAVLAAVAFPTVSSAQQGGPTLSGTVVDLRGHPVAAATVRAEGPVTRSAETDARGAFRMGTVPAGTYRVEVEALGYRGEPVVVDVTAPPAAVRLTVDATPIALQPLEVVTAVRGNKPAVALPIKVDVLEARQVALQQTLASNPTEMLANLVPSYSPGRQKLTSSGESFRGRRPLFLIDGVPQSNPLRDGRRDGFTIGMEAVERVEVVFGANALQGLGATGGIVNYVTVDAPLEPQLEQRLTLSATTDDGFVGDSRGWRAHYLAAKRWGAFDAVASASVEQRGLYFDGQGRPVALDNVQGDVADSRSRGFFGKLGWEPDADQRLEVMVSDFRLAQDGDFDAVPGDRSAGLPATSVEGRPRGTLPLNDVTTASLDYEHRALGGGTLSAKLYYQDFAALFGGGVFGVFQDPAIAPVGSLFDQSENNSTKVGTRLTWARTGIGGDALDVVTGVDLLRDETFQRLVQSDRNWVPTTRFLNLAPFAQLDLALTRTLTVSGGLRWEVASLDVPDFSTLAGNRSDFRSVGVAGGSPSFDEPLWNLGAVLRPVDGFRVYATAAQAYTMPDVGRVLRGVSAEDTRVEDFLALTPVKTDNLEAGAAWNTARSRVGVTWFASESELGSRLVPDADGIFQVRREPTRTSGWEFTARVDPSRTLSLNAGMSLLEGRYDGDDDGVLDSDLGAADIGPGRLNLSADLAPAGPLSGRVQLFRYFDRDFHDAAGATVASFDGYTTMDASGSAQLGTSTLTLAVTNLFDTQYITYFGQAATDRDDRYFAGRGRTLTLKVERRF